MLWGGCCALERLQLVRNALVPIALDVLCLAGVDLCRDLRVHGNARPGIDALVLGDGLDLGLAKDLVARAAVRALVVGHVLDERDHGDVHMVGHADGLLDDHVDEHLRGSCHDDALERELLEDGHGDVAGSRRHVDEQVVELAPVDVAVELGEDAVEHRATPQEGLRLVGRQHVGGDDLDAGLGDRGREHAALVNRRRLVDAERTRDRGARDVAVEDADGMAATTQLAGEQRGGQGFADTAFARCDGDNLVNLGALVDGKLLRCLARSAPRIAASRAIGIAALFCHGILHSSRTNLGVASRALKPALTSATTKYICNVRDYLTWRRIRK